VPDTEGRVTKAHLCATHTPTPLQLRLYIDLATAREELAEARACATLDPDDTAAVVRQSRAWVAYRGAISALGAQVI
jgi:hypothetical protein